MNPTKHRPAFLTSVLLLFAAFPVAAQQPGVLEQAFRAGTSEEKRSALYEIRNLASAEASRIAIVALSDADAAVRATAAGSVIGLPSDEAVRALLPNLSDREPFVRSETAWALGKVGHPAAVKRLLEIAGTDRVNHVRAAAIIASGEIGDSSALGFLIGLLERKASANMAPERAAAAKAIGRIALKQLNRAASAVTPENFLPEKYKSAAGGGFPDLTARSGDFLRASLVFERILKDTKESADTRREAAFALGAVTGGVSGSLETCAGSADYYLAEICREGLARRPR
jgi:HEAT repeat protein